ncbi:site-specific DNA-methyltransferase [Acidovorax sp. Leaf78]|uniref:DNA-methyltransferase n=1 Tax=Acidovorax sp. Leaf78 TaxID=1736237 RepID=UPI001F21627D|nr:site-specific DNA-methyltransferase [Acidovorax sp. Leaf78]
MPDNTVDSVVCDPPYGLSFMGKRWDYDVPSVDVWAECLRVLKPGGHLLAFAGTRTQHRMAVRIEDAGFEIRDMIAWVYGSGFPKSHNGDWGGTALKPALEPITLARKPLNGTVAENWGAYGTGALNIAACRVGDEARTAAFTSFAACSNNALGAPGTAAARRGTQGDAQEYVGRWPANLVHDGSDEVLEAFPAAPGQLVAASTSTTPRDNQNVYGAMQRGRGEEPSAASANGGAVGFKMKPGMRRDATTSAARFFYCAKASREDRNEGLESFAAPAVRTDATMGDRERAYSAARNGNHHPTVKPTTLMAYLVRLVTPAGGVVLDPFMGSGSTGKAALPEGFQFIGIEREPAYFDIACRRVEQSIAQGSLFAQPCLEHA